MGKTIITIGRQFGSGGHEIGAQLAKELGIPLYDRNLIEMAAKELNLTTAEAESLDEKALTGFIASYQTAWNIDAQYYLAEYAESLSDQLYKAQAAIIRQLADQGACVIVGRCADYILRKRKDVLSVFICAEKEDRIQRLMEVRDMTEREAAAAIKKNDKSRRTYYNNYTGQEWDSPLTHHMVMNVSLLGREKIVEILKDIYQK